MGTPLRARWIARRTVGLKPQPTDETVGGHPVIAMGGYAVVLPEGVRHFRPLVRCSRCGERFVAFWSPVLRRADLENPPANRMCEKCTRALVQ